MADTGEEGRRNRLGFAALIIFMMAQLIPAAAFWRAEPPKEFLHADTSSHEILIKADFKGTQIVVFGAVENSRQPAANSGFYDIVIVIRGPGETLIARRKSRFAGVWLNRDAQTFAAVPSYYAVLSTRPLNEIAADDLLLKHGIGLENMTFQPATFGEPPDYRELQGFRDALIRIKEQQGLYRQERFRVAFISPSLFRGTAELPANVKAGHYTAEIFLFREGRLLSNYRTKIEFEKAGLEAYVHAMAFNRPVIYGLAAVIMAVGAGLLASAVFRRR